MPVLSGQSLGKAYQATEARNHRGVRIRDHLGKGRRPIPGYQTHENRELRTTGNARPPQSQVTEPLERVRDVRNSARGVPSLETITEVDSLHTGTRAAHDEGFGGTYRELPLSNPVLPQQLRVSTSTKSKIRIPEFVQGDRVTQRNAETSFLSGNEGTLEEDDALTKPYGSTGAGGNYHLNPVSAVLQSEWIRNFQVCDFLKDQDMAFSSRCRGCAAFQIRKQKIPGEETFTPNVSWNNSSGVHDSMDEGHDNEKRRKTIGKCTKTANPAA